MSKLSSLGVEDVSEYSTHSMRYQKGKTIPDRIWDDGTGNYHEKVQSDQIGDFRFGLSQKKIKDIIS